MPELPQPRSYISYFDGRTLEYIVIEGNQSRCFATSLTSQRPPVWPNTTEAGDPLGMPQTVEVSRWYHNSNYHINSDRPPPPYYTYRQNGGFRHSMTQQQVQASHTNGNHEMNNYNYGYPSFVNPPDQTSAANGHTLPNNTAVPMNPAEGTPQKPQTDAQTDQGKSKIPKLENTESKNSCVSSPLPDSPTSSVLEARRRQAQADKESEEKTDQQPTKEVSKDGSKMKEDEKIDVKQEDKEAKDLTPSPESSTSRQTDPDFQP
ncbi:hypothetical protein CA3LBN_000911 [Candidozyma haemuli]|uniref:Uncharacterized protein n=1 Tax=Candidozyma haemuli TaxID=45357 RepID=A0ABX8I2K2_9ASCO|nr:hypothetical protein CA3LBN_000911 [[Candida] haemuloni]